MWVVCTRVHICGLYAYPVSVVCLSGGGTEGRVQFLTAETMNAIQKICVNLSQAHLSLCPCDDSLEAEFRVSVSLRGPGSTHLKDILGKW